MPTHPCTNHARRRIGSRDLDALIDAIHDESSDDEAWKTTIVAMAVHVFDGLSGSLDIIEHHVEPPHDPSHIRIVGHPDSTSSVVLSVVRDRPLQLGPYERARLARTALHLENVVRLRRPLERVRGWVSRDGDVLDQDAIGVGSQRRSDLWHDLVEGRVSLATSKRLAPFYVVLDVPTRSRDRRALTDAELRVVTLSACGMSGKDLAYALGLSAPSISRALGSSAAKVGLRTRFELVRVAARLAINETAAFVAPLRTERLTPAECVVLELVRAGHSNRAIAELRGRSERTIAHQVSSLLRKTMCASRRVLAASHRRDATMPPPPVTTRASEMHG